MAMSNKTLVMPLQCDDFRPHLIEAVINWCEGRGQTPYMLVELDDACEVPRQYANSDNSIVFCVESEAVNNFLIDDEAVSFQARFGENIRSVRIPLNRVAAVYPKEDPNLVTYFPVTASAEKSKKKSMDDAVDIPLCTKV